MSVLVLPRFRRELLLHVFCNYNLPEVEPSLVLGIHGPAGEGKSCQCAAVFREMRLDVHAVPMASFESNFAGDPAELLQKTYDDCVKEKLEGSNPVVLIEDFDVAVGDFGAQYTVNTQHVLGTLMALAERVRAFPSQRVPVVVTGNDFGKLYGPLTRPGRMRLFEWAASPQEKAAIVRRIFPGLGAGEPEKLIRACDERGTRLGLDSVPVSLYAEARSRLVDDVVCGELEAGFPLFPRMDERNALAGNVAAILGAKGYDDVLAAVSAELERRARSAGGYPGRRSVKGA